MSAYCLPADLPRPVWNDDDLYAPYWRGLQSGKLMVQRNPRTGTYQWPAQPIAHDTLTFNLEWAQVPAEGTIYSWSRIWHPVHPALSGFGPYLVVVVELAIDPSIRMLGNLVADPLSPVTIGAPVVGVFEHHLEDAASPYTLLQWKSAIDAG